MLALYRHGQPNLNSHSTMRVQNELPMSVCVMSSVYGIKFQNKPKKFEHFVTKFIIKKTFWLNVG